MDPAHHLAPNLVTSSGPRTALITGLDGKANKLAGRLVYGEQRRLEIARVMCTQPRRTARKWLRETPASAAPDAASGRGPALSSPKQLAWLLVRPTEELSPSDAAAVRRAEQDQEAALVASLSRWFTALVRRCGVGQPTRPTASLADLDAWLAEARACGVSAVDTFAAGMEPNGAAVRAALTQPWSSGQAEGQVNRLKLLKRQSYGRAGFDLLRQRVLMAT